MNVQHPFINWDAHNFDKKRTIFKDHATLYILGSLARKTVKVQCANLLSWLEIEYVKSSGHLISQLLKWIRQQHILEI